MLKNEIVYEADIDSQYLLRQAGLIYEMARETINDDDRDLLMGVSALLYHIQDGSLRLMVVCEYANRGVY
jgi:hypothetical protein